MFKKVDPRRNFPEMEKQVLEFWKSEKVFEESMSDGARPIFSFYDGPPFATGLPHYGHVVASLIKDAVPRYWTMKGNRVDRRWGWDCHGLPVENLIEKELGIENKQQIEELGVDKFNEACCGSVQRYAKEWKEFIPRVGRWVDMENDYRTMDWKFTESIWWVFSEIYKKGLVYEGYKAMHMCPRCDTTLANFEVTQGYKDITDISATVKFKLKAGQKIGDFEVDENTYMLAWTTTPWTLPGNVALAVGKDIEYALIRFENNAYIFAKEKINELISKLNIHSRPDSLFQDRGGDNAQSQGIETLKTFKGFDLVGLSYEPMFNYYAQKEDLANRENGWKIYAGDFVTTEEGVGVVHIAPAFGEDDMKLGREMKLPFVQHVSRTGHFVEFVESLSEGDKLYFVDKEGQGREVKPKRNPRETDEKVVDYLRKENILFASENYKHSYPHCWRCDTPLLNYASGSWFVEVTKIKDRLVANNQQVNWVPGYIKDGRFGKWLEDARDWAVSRSRFWGAPLPIWKCEECAEIEVIGSIADLERKADPKSIGFVKRDNGEFDLHKPYIDKVELKCPKCGKPMRIIGDVFDCWFESGSMPYAQLHYPFENKEKFEKSYPADFIAEGIDQTRGWFYTLMVLSTALFDKPAFKNVIVNGIVLAEDGQKMSKKLKNYPDPNLILEKYGADSLRYYLFTSPVMKAENLRFSEKGVDEVLKKFVLTLWNTYSFLVMNAELGKIEKKEITAYKESGNLLDKWIISELNLLILEVDKGMQNYDLVKASRPLMGFVDELSNWYVRRSRRRFVSEDVADKLAAYRTLYHVLVTFTKLMAPFMPFIADEIFRNLTDKKSVHLEVFPEADTGSIDENLSRQMETAREIVTLGLAVRAQNHVKVRMPLQTLLIRKTGVEEFKDELIEILKDELNIKEVKIADVVAEKQGWGVSPEGNVRVALDLNLTEDLELEGMSREVVRQIQAMRKDARYQRDDAVNVKYSISEGAAKSKKMFERWAEEIKKECLLLKLESSEAVKKEDFDGVAELALGGERIILGIKK
jgi:isoleucyl-tRNA synthetase